MKKISLKKLNLQDVEQLSREQLKNVLGGYSGGTTAPGPPDDPTTTMPNDDTGNPPAGCKIWGGIHGGQSGQTYYGICTNKGFGEICLDEANNVYQHGCIY